MSWYEERLDYLEKQVKEKDKEITELKKDRDRLKACAEAHIKNMLEENEI